MRWLEGLLPEALVAGIADALEGKHPAVPVDAGASLGAAKSTNAPMPFVVSVSRRWLQKV